MNLREFGSWALAQNSVANPSPNFKYKGQCVSLIQQYLALVFGIGFKAHGNAKDWANNVPDGFNKLAAGTKLERGDILVYGSNYGNGYGHIGLIDANWKYLDQNGVKSLAIGYRDNAFRGNICVLRKQGGVDCGDVQNNAFKVRVDKAEANVRTEPHTTARCVSQPGGYRCLVKGNTFTAVDIVDGQFVDGSNKWYKSAMGNFVHSYGLTKI